MNSQNSSHALRPDALSPSALTRLVLTNFRNYARIEIDLDARPVILTGPNGAGKTNLLEAVSFLIPGRGLRRARLSDVNRQEKIPEAAPSPHVANINVPMPEGQSWAVAASVLNPKGLFQIGTGKDPAFPANDRRIVHIDGKAQKGQGVLANYLSVTWLTPQMDRLFMEGATERRRFLDRLVYGFDPAQAERVTALEKSVRERGRLLQEGKFDPSWLGVLEQQIAIQSVAITVARESLLAALNIFARERGEPFPQAHIRLTGLVAEWIAERGHGTAQQTIMDVLGQTRRQDAESGGASVGAHKADIQVKHLGKGRLAPECSTGEQKALLITLILGQAQLLAEHKGTPPIILMDEVAAHLDESRRRKLGEEILALGAQAWCAGTDDSLFESLRNDAQFFHVENGQIR
jgi:DNA replication and repair protein RecF